MKHIVIGTAGHVDHGKTVLVKALTGVDTDRLKEEKKRGISIELGFARFNLPSGLQTSIIDVPGHERFIKNMLAGVGGIDIVMLVVAADEGVMPQTREHLDIIQLLQVKKGVVVITKKDLVDEEWLSLVYDDLTESLRGTVLEGAQLVTVSAMTGENMDHLRQVLDNLASEIEEKKSSGFPRLPVDRVFSVVGFGTVATGTLLSGQIKPGDNLQIYPGDTMYRVRNLHVHGQRVDLAEAGQRVAVNLTGAEKNDISRGSVLGTPGSLKPSHRLDVKLKYLAGAPRPLQHRARVRVHLGTLEILGRVILLDREKLQPGAETYLQLQLENTVAVARGDHFVIRSYSPMRTIGGGTIIDPAPVRHRRYRKEVMEALAMAEKGTPDQLVEQHLSATDQALTIKNLSRGTGLDLDETRTALEHLLTTGLAIKLSSDGEDHYLSTGVLVAWENKILTALAKYHHKYPLREGYLKEEIRSRFFVNLNAKQFQMLISHWEQSGKIDTPGSNVALKGFLPQPAPEIREKIKLLEQMFIETGFQPPNWSDATDQVGIKDTDTAQELLNYLLAKGTLVKLAEGIYLHDEALQRAITLIRNHLTQKGEISLGDVRDLLQTTRKYTLPLLEYLDKEKITRRVGDMRVLGKMS